MGQLKVQPYWNHNFRDRNLPETRSVDELIQGVRERMIDAVRARLRSDVPLAVSQWRTRQCVHRWYRLRPLEGEESKGEGGDIHSGFPRQVCIPCLLCCD